MSFLERVGAWTTSLVVALIMFTLVRGEFPIRFIEKSETTCSSPANR